MNFTTTSPWQRIALPLSIFMIFITSLVAQTMQQAVLLKDIRVGTASSSPENLTSLFNKIVFTADDGTNGKELWASDGTQVGTTLIKDFIVGSGSPTFSPFVELGGTAFFTVTFNETPQRIELWKTEGTPLSTLKVFSFTDALPNVSFILGNMFTANNKVYIPMSNVSPGQNVSNSIWESNGFSGGTRNLGDMTLSFQNEITPSYYYEKGQPIFCVTTSNSCSNPLATGSIIVIDSSGVRIRVPFGSASSPGACYAKTLGVMGRNLYFLQANTVLPTPTTKVSLFKVNTDGVKTVVIDSFSTYSRMINTQSFIKSMASNNWLYFIYELQMWKSDGTTSGTSTFSGSADTRPIEIRTPLVEGDIIYFTDNNSHYRYWKVVNGIQPILISEESYPLLLISSLKRVGDKIYSFGSDPTDVPNSLLEIKSSDGQSRFTKIAESRQIRFTPNIGNTSTALLFAFNDATQGIELGTLNLNPPVIAPCDTDRIAPVISNCPQNILLTTATTSAIATWATPTATDNCTATPSVSSNYTSGSPFGIGTTVVTYTATDAKNNTATCSFSINVLQQSNNLPDLFESNLLLLNNPVAAGDTLRFQSSFGNIGNAATSPTIPFHKGIFLSTDAVLSANDLQISKILYAQFTVGFLGLNSPVYIKIPSTVPAGQYYVISKIDVDEVILESSENNNIAVSPATITVTNPVGTANCASKSNAPWSEWIANVTLANLNNVSSKTRDDRFVVGYSDWTDKTATVSRSQTYPLSITPGLSWAGYQTNLFFRAWIDFNNNGIYEDTELVLEKNSVSAAVNQSLTIPATAFVGTVKMRVSMKKDAYPTACESFAAGEVEDYSVVIQAGGVDPCATDVTPPVLTNCPANISLTTTGTTAIATWAAPTATDNCGNPSVSSTYNSGFAFPIGTATVTYTATDAKNNTATCRFTVSVTAATNPCATDVIPPVIANCPANISVTTTGTTAIATWTAPTATDNCGTPSVSSTYNSGFAFPIGTATVTYTATDAKNNTATCRFTVTVTAQTGTANCTSKSNAPWSEWIANVQFNTLNNASSKTRDDRFVVGYSDWKDKSTTVSRSQTYPLSITPGLSWPGYQTPLYFRAWIDFNRNGIYEDTELVLEKNSNSVLVNQSVTIPATASIGTTTMRVSMKKGAYPTACESFDLGEVEDYTVVIQDGSPTSCANNALNFDGIDDYLQTPQYFIPANSNFTLEASFTSTATTSGCSGNFKRLLALELSNSLNRLEIGECSGQLTLFYFISGGNSRLVNIPNAINLRDGNFHHVAAVKTGDILTIYYDGVLVLTESGLQNINNVARELYVGRWGLQGENWQGNVDEVRVWNYAVTATDIVTRRNCQLLGTESGLILYFPFNQGISGGSNTTITNVIDKSPSNITTPMSFFGLQGSTSNFVCSTQTLTQGCTTDPCASDVIAPSLSNCPQNISLISTANQCKMISFTPPSATDNCSTNPPVSFTLKNGSSILNFTPTTSSDLIIGRWNIETTYEKTIDNAGNVLSTTLLPPQNGVTSVFQNGVYTTLSTNGIWELSTDGTKIILDKGTVDERYYTITFLTTTEWKEIGPYRLNGQPYFGNKIYEYWASKKANAFVNICPSIPIDSVIYTATDGRGNKSTCTFGINVSFPTTCIPSVPAKIYAKDITATTATLVWSKVGNAIEYEYQFLYDDYNQPNGGALISSGIRTDTFVNLTLVGGRLRAIVRSRCTANGAWSAWSNATMFNLFNEPCTLGARTAFVEDFESGSYASPQGFNLPLCWTKLTYHAPTVYESWVDVRLTSRGTIGNATKRAIMFRSTPLDSSLILMITPEIANLSAGTNRLRFKAANTWGSELAGAGRVQLGTMSNIYDGSTFVPFGSPTVITDNNFREYTVDFTTYGGTNRFIAFKYLDAGGDLFRSLEIDEVVWETKPTVGSSSDIELTIVSNPTTYRQWTTNLIRVTAKNIGTTPMTNVKIELKRPDKMAYGGTKTPSVGAFNDYCAGGIECSEWVIPSLAAGATATLDAPFFVLDAIAPIVVTTRLLASTPTDGNAANNSASVSITPQTAVVQALRQKPTQLIPVVIQTIAPNPTDGELRIQLESLDAREVSFTFFNALGKAVKTETKAVEKGLNRVEFSVSDFEQGMYFVIPSTNQGHKVPTKFVKL